MEFWGTQATQKQWQSMNAISVVACRDVVKKRGIPNEDASFLFQAKRSQRDFGTLPPAFSLDFPESRDTIPIAPLGFDP
jgi:hypothetical protein